eukprot:gene14844-15030_t
MGLTKKLHIAELAALPEVAAQLKPTDTVDSLYQDFLDVQQATIAQAEFVSVIPGVLEAVAWLKTHNIKIGSTTGYSRFMIPKVVAAAKQQGYDPDVIVTVDE